MDSLKQNVVNSCTTLRAVVQEGANALREHPRRRNVALTLAYTCVDAFARSVWGAQTLSLYVYALFDDNRHIGFAEGAVAFLTFCAAVPGSRLTDHFSRDLIVRFTALLAIVAYAFVLLDIILFSSNNVDAYAFLTTGLAVWGFFNGMMLPALQSIYAESASSSAEREKVESLRYALQVIAVVLGGLLNVIVAAAMGNDWTMNSLRTVVVVGATIQLLGAGLMLFLEDAKSPDDVVAEQEQNRQEHRSARIRKRQDAEERGLTDGITEPLVIPLLILAEVLSAIASGASVLYIPTFLMNKVLMSPVGIHLYYTTLPVVVAGGSVYIQWVAKNHGRLRTAVAFKVIGIVLLFSLTLLKPLWKRAGLFGKIFICLLLSLRAACMNGPFTLLRAFRLQHEPLNEWSRMKWATVELASSLMWSVGAVVGGLCVDYSGYRMTFNGTIGMQLIALVPLVLLLPLDARVHPDVDDIYRHSTASQTSTPKRRMSTRRSRTYNRSEESLPSTSSYQLPAYIPPSSGAMPIDGGHQEPNAPGRPHTPLHSLASSYRRLSQSISKQPGAGHRTAEHSGTATPLSTGDGNEHRFSYQELLRLQVKLQQEEEKKRHMSYNEDEFVQYFQHKVKKEEEEEQKRRASQALASIDDAVPAAQDREEETVIPNDQEGGIVGRPDSTIRRGVRDAEARETDPLLPRAGITDESVHSIGRMTEQIALAYCEVIPAWQHSRGVGSIPMGE